MYVSFNYHATQRLFLLTSVAQAAPDSACPTADRADNQVAVQIKGWTSVQPSKCPGNRQTRSRFHTSLPRALGPRSAA